MNVKHYDSGCKKLHKGRTPEQRDQQWLSVADNSVEGVTFPKGTGVEQRSAEFAFWMSLEMANLCVLQVYNLA